MTAMAYDEDVNAVLENIVKAREDIKELFICTKNTIDKIKDQLNFPTSDTGAGDGVFLDSINTLLLSKEVENRIDEATWEPAIVLFSRKKSQLRLLPFICGLELLPKDWTDHACATVYEKNINSDKDHVSIYFYGDDEIIGESEQINMDETGCKPETDWPERAANADPRSTVVFFRTSLIEMLNRGLKVVEVYGTEDDLANVIANIEKHNIRPNVIVYVIDALEEQTSLLQKLQSRKLLCVLYPYKADVGDVTSKLSELHLNHKVYADVQESPHLLRYLTRCAENNVNELTKTACENLVESNKKLINLFEDQLQKMFKPCPRNESDPNSIDPIKQYFDVIKNSEEKYEERFKKVIIILRDDLQDSNNETWDAVRELFIGKEIDVTSFPTVIDFYWTDFFCCDYRRNCYAQIDNIIKECVQKTLLENFVTSEVKFRQLGDDAVQELSKLVCDALEQKLSAFHDDFTQKINDDSDDSNLFLDIAYEKRRQLRSLMEKVTVNELKAQCWLDRSHFIDIQEQEVIGEGTGGYVFKVGRNAELLAMKVLSFRDESRNVEIERIATEVHNLRLFQHPNIVSILGSQIRDDEVRILMPLLKDAKRFIKSCPPFLRKLELASHVAHALQYLHGRNVFHRDVKWQNVLISDDGVGKLCDFGHTLLESSSQKSNCGTDPYRAPEIGNGPYDKSVDIYAFGTLLWTFVEGEEPRIRRTSGGGSYELLTPKTLCSHRKCNRCWPHLINICRDCRPRRRPTIEEVIRMLTEMMHLKHW